MEEMVHQVPKARMFQQGHLLQKLCVTKELNTTILIQKPPIAVVSVKQLKTTTTSGSYKPTMLVEKLGEEGATEGMVEKLAG